MPRKVRNTVAQSAIILATLVGGVTLTQHFSASTGAFASAAPSSGTTAGSSTTPAPTGKPDKTVTSANISYPFGTVQLSVTRTAGKIAKIDIGSSTATNGRYQAFPVLVQAAISAQGTNFGNLSGATYTTDAFKQALSSAITKLG